MKFKPQFSLKAFLVCIFGVCLIAVVLEWRTESRIREFRARLARESDNLSHLFPEWESIGFIRIEIIRVRSSITERLLFRKRIQVKRTWYEWDIGEFPHDELRDTSSQIIIGPFGEYLATDQP